MPSGTPAILTWTVTLSMSKKQTSFQIEALVEDRSGGMIMAGLLEKVLAAQEKTDPETTWNLLIRPHRGIGNLPKELDKKPDPYTSSLLGLFPAKLRAYKTLSAGEGADLILVILDSDDQDNRKLFNSIRSTARSIAPKKSLIIGLAVEELEAWVLGDREAVLAAYPDANRKILEKYEQDSICGTWEVLARAVMGAGADDLIEAGYPAVGMYKAEWAAKIAPLLEPERNVSPSFKRFYKALKFVLENPESILERSSSEDEFKNFARSR